MRVTFEDGGGGGGERRDAAPEPSARPLGRAIGRGVRGHCPTCGTGRLFAGYLAVAPACDICGERFSGHRADDLPPYLTILVVGHVVVSGLLIGERLYQPDVTLALAFWLPVTVVLTLALLRPIKGGVVALQWALRLHGFAAAGAQGREPPSPTRFDPPPPAADSRPSPSAPSRPPKSPE